MGDRSERYRSRSLWFDDLPGDDLTPRPALAGDTTVDVCVVGAGYTGVWTAYELKRRDPALRVLVVEAEIAGFGASGRNGGWCSADLPMSPDALAKRHGRDAAVRMYRAMQATVDEVGRVVTEEGIDCGFTKGGALTLATLPTHAGRLSAELEEVRSYGFDETDLRLLDRSEARRMVAADGVLGGLFTPHCAALQPARLARGLARACEARGVTIVEGTRARSLEPHRVTTTHGTVTADIVVRATEAYTVRFDGRRRDLAPLYSLMIATEPLPASFWDEVGWATRCTLDDARTQIIYAQRTADDRIAFGGRGAPYHFASRIRDGFDRDAKVFERLRRTLTQLFPALEDAAITHQWGGPLGAPRDWTCAVRFDRATGFATAGGYVGDGVATTNLAGRTLADLITGTTSDLTDLPWVGHESPRWEREPLRWLAINGALRLAGTSDAAEARTGRPSRRRRWLLGKLRGR
jgi:glycine/D-amino acid oxidase-like deaminating enzyme